MILSFNQQNGIQGGNKLKLEKLEKMGWMIDIIAFLFIPMLAVMFLEIWWLSLMPRGMMPSEAIIYTLPISLPAIAYFILILSITQERSKPIIIGYWYTRKLNEEWDKIKHLPISVPQKDVRT